MLQMERQVRELALFNLAIDSKLRGCDLVAVRVDDVAPTNHKAKWMKSEALLTGRIFDDRGNRMTPSHARRGNVKYRYYLSSALLQGTTERAGSVRRVPATDVESLVIRSVREHLKPTQSIDDRSLISTRVARLEVQPMQLVIHLTEEPKATANRKKTRANGALHVPWQRTPSTRRREILLPEGMTPQHAQLYPFGNTGNIGRRHCPRTPLA
jgi:site-specific DNA recombinase